MGMGTLSGRVAIVTGASSGIGRGCALRLAVEGATVVLCARRLERLEAVVAEIEAAGGTALAVKCDITSEEEIANVVTSAAGAFGRIDILVNVAQAGLDDMHTYLADVTAERLHEWYQGGAVQSLLFMQKCFPYMKEQKFGRIINTASHAVMGAKGLVAYAMTKGAVMALTRAASQEWAEFGIVTNTIMPMVLTESWDFSPRTAEMAEKIPDLIPIRRLGTPYEDLAPVVAFLASEQAGYVNGQTLVLDGGWKLMV
jgi:NAD(P)-dependent dehydrogenase (short-subunit alcohol dehydrogenase family)